MHMKSIMMHLSVQKYKKLFLHKKEFILLKGWKCFMTCKTKNFSVFERFGWPPMFK